MITFDEHELLDLLKKLREERETTGAGICPLCFQIDENNSGCYCDVDD